MKEISIWIDDDRKPMQGFNIWYRRTFDGLRAFIISNRKRIVRISYDNTLHASVEGHQLLTELEGDVLNRDLRLPRLREIGIHTADGNKVIPMIETARRIAAAHDHEIKVCRIWYDHFLDDLRDQGALAQWFTTPFDGPTH